MISLFYSKLPARAFLTTVTALPPSLPTIQQGAGADNINASLLRAQQSTGHPMIALGEDNEGFQVNLIDEIKQ